MQTKKFKLFRFFSLVVIVSFSVIRDTRSENIFASEQSKLHSVASESKSLNAPPNDGSNWQLVFGDEFNGASLDTNKWTTCQYWTLSDGGCVGGLGEIGWFRPQNVWLQNGYVRLRADRSWYLNPEGRWHEYTAGAVTSKNKYDFTYGYVEARIKVPKGAGLWPQFWLHPAPNDGNVIWPPEIDIVELVSKYTDVAHLTFHFVNANGENDSTGFAYQSNYDYSMDWHVFAVDWRTDAVIWYIDGVERFRVTERVPTIPMNIIAALPVGGWWPGYPDQTTPFPAYMDVDYLRVWQRGNAFPTTGTFDARVRNANNTASIGQSVVVYQNNALIKTQSTDTNGSTVFTLPPGSYQICLSQTNSCEWRTLNNGDTQVLYFTATNVSTPTPTPPTNCLFPSAWISDDFNRTDSVLGYEWQGGKWAFYVENNKLRVINTAGVSAQWLSFNSNQEAYVTMAALPASGQIGLVLKAQDDSNKIVVYYTVGENKIEVWTVQGGAWTLRQNIDGVTWQVGSQLGARARSDGFVEVFMNGSHLATVNASTSFNFSGGDIGVFTNNAINARLDDFGGGNAGCTN